MKRIFIIVLVLFLTSCASLKNKATIEKTSTGIMFTASQPCEMSMKEGETEYKFDGKSESLFSKIISIFTLGMVGRK